MKTRLEKVIDVADWDELVSSTYNKPYSFQQQDGCKERGKDYISVPVENPNDYENTTIPEIVNHPKMGVSFSAWLERDPEQKLAEDDDYDWIVSMWWNRNFYPHVDMIINDLYQKGLLAAGEYTIDIDW